MDIKKVAAREVQAGDVLVLKTSREVEVTKVATRNAYDKNWTDLKGTYRDGFPWANSYPADATLAVLLAETFN